MTVLSMHHWENRSLAFSEINRVETEKFVAITWGTVNPRQFKYEKQVTFLAY